MTFKWVKNQIKKKIFTKYNLYLQFEKLIRDSLKLANEVGANVDKCFSIAEKINGAKEKIYDDFFECFELSSEPLEINPKSIKRDIEYFGKKIEELKSEILANNDPNLNSNPAIAADKSTKVSSQLPK